MNRVEMTPPDTPEGIYCKITIERGTMMLLMPDGTPIPCQISCIVNDEVNKFPIATVTVRVDLLHSETVNKAVNR